MRFMRENRLDSYDRSRVNPRNRPVLISDEELTCRAFDAWVHANPQWLPKPDRVPRELAREFARAAREEERMGEE